MGSLMKDSRSLRAIQVAERYADDLTIEDLRREAEQGARQAHEEGDPAGPERCLTLPALHAVKSWGFEASYMEAATGAAVAIARSVDPDDTTPRFQTRWQEERETQCRILRCLFGNPFRYVSFGPSRRTPDVLGLATGIYEERAFDRLPYLADALEEAGCTEQAILGHCRQGGEHWRGCWVVDFCLGRQ
jgi:hypothetical protein